MAIKRRKLRPKKAMRSVMNGANGDDSDSTIVDNYDDFACCADAGTQTESVSVADDTIGCVWSFINEFNNARIDDEFEDVLCDCKSDECCDQCCDRRSEMCECDCERCEFDKCHKRIPQLDGIYDDESDEQSPAYKDDSDDSDFDFRHEVTSAKKRNAKRKNAQKDKRSPPSKKRKSTTKSYDSDSDNLFGNSFSKSKPGPASSKRKVITSTNSFSISSISPPSEQPLSTSEKLFDKYKQTQSKSRAREDSPMFSDSESGKQTSENEFINIEALLSSRSSQNKRNTRSSSKKDTPAVENDNFSDRSLTPHYSDEDDIPDSKPGPKNSKPGSKSSKTSSSNTRAGPQSSKASKPGPKSSKAAANAKPGPKSNKLAPSRPGPKSSKTRAQLAAISSPESDDFESLTAANTRTRRSQSRTAKIVVNSDDEFSSESNPKTIAVKSNAKKSTPKSYLRRGSIQSESDTESALIWKVINGNRIQLDIKLINDDSVDVSLIGKEEVIVEQMSDSKAKDYVESYWANIEYWNEEKANIESHNKKSITRSKGALKDFYTLPHLNETKAHKKVKSPPKSKANVAKPAKSSEVEKLLEDAKIMKVNSSSGRMRVTAKRAKTVKKKETAKQSNAKSKGDNSKRNAAQRSSSRVKRTVTSSTVFTSVSFPFYESDIKVVTTLTGAQKLDYLKSLCSDLKLNLEMLDKKWVKNYMNSKISPLVFADDIYYNDYSEFLTEEKDANFADDIRNTMRYVVDNVIATNVVMNKLLDDMDSNEFMNEFYDESEYDSHWNFGLREIPLEEAPEGLPATYEMHENETNVEHNEENFETDAHPFEERESEQILPVDRSDESHDELNEDTHENDSDMGKRDDSNEANNAEYEGSTDNGSPEQTVNEGYESNNNEDCESNANEDCNGDGEDEAEAADNSCVTFDIATQVESEELSPDVPQNYENESNDSNENNEYSDEYHDNRQSMISHHIEEGEDAKEELIVERTSMRTNAPIDMSQIGVTHVAMHPTSGEQSNVNVNVMQQQYNSRGIHANVNYQLNNLPQQTYIPVHNVQNATPMMARITHQNHHYSPQNVYPQQPHWPQMQMSVTDTSYNVQSINTQTAPQESDYEVPHYPYDMYHYNHNIPQFDGANDNAYS